jgi:hypothetical protein
MNDWLQWRLSWLVGQFGACSTFSPSLHGCGGLSRSLRSESYARMKEFVHTPVFIYPPVRRFLGDVCREFMQRALLWFSTARSVPIFVMPFIT